jgi:hypothetical protein
LKPVEFGAFDEAGADMVVSFAGWEAYIRHQERKRLVDIDRVQSGAERLVGKGILRPTEVPAFVALAENLAAGNQVVAFGQGDEAERVDAFDMLMRLMGARQPLVILGEYDPDSDWNGDATNLAMPAGMHVDRGRAELHAQATAYAAAHNVPYRKAVLAVSGRSPS